MSLLDEISRSNRQGTGALARLKCMQAIWSNYTREQATEFLRSLDLEGGMVLWNNPIDDSSLRWFLWNSGTRYWLFVNGIVNLYQGLQVWNGYLGPAFLGQLGSLGKNLKMNEWAEVIVSQVEPRLVAASNLMVVGHSAGGYVAFLVAAKLAARRLFQEMSVEVFGTPKIGVNEEPAFNRSVVRHWYNVDDPVVGIPPTPGFDQPWLAAYNPGQIAALTYYGNFYGGTMIGIDGSLTDQPAPPPGPDPEWVNAGAWLLNLTQGVDTPHNLPRYIERMTLAVREHPNQVQIIPARGHTTIAPIGVQEAAQMQRSGLENSYYSPRPSPPAGVLIPKPQMFKAKKIGRGKYVVYFGDAMVFIGPRKKTARHVANVGNELLRTMPRLARVDLAAFSDALLRYLEAAASDPGFTPNIQPS